MMAADNHTTIVGNLVEDPEVRITNTGIAVTNLRVAVTQRVQQDGQWRDGETSFFKVNVWRGQAENLADSLAKGDRLWSPAGSGSAAGRPARGRSGRSPSWRPTSRRLPQVGHRQGRTGQPARQRRAQPGSGATRRTRRRLQRPGALLSSPTSAPSASGRGRCPTDRRGNGRSTTLLRRQNLNHALYLMAIVQIRHPTSGQAYYRRKRAEGKASKEALRRLKRRLSDAVYRCLMADQRSLWRIWS